MQGRDSGARQLTQTPALIAADDKVALLAYLESEHGDNVMLGISDEQQMDLPLIHSNASPFFGRGLFRYESQCQLRVRP